MTPHLDSPQARLVASRKALLRQMAGNDAPDGSDTPSDGQPTDKSTHSQRSSMWQVLTQAVTAWWQHHPAQIAIDIGRPFLSNYAKDKPFKLLGIAAGIGAAAVVIKPWRLVSVTGLALSALKSTRLSTTLLSLLPRAIPKEHASQTEQTLKNTR